MMKKIILIIGVFLSMSLWASPMDKVCTVEGVNGKLGARDTRFIRNNCERNNILSIADIKEVLVIDAINNWCRFDRNIHVEPTYEPVISDDIPEFKKRRDVTCVLYDTEFRLSVLDKSRD